ncbi:MAG: DHH family phosphoesterase [Thermodesulfobacteriota bacterium]|nr:DHH family phosphoesterase [Thermodesulfobacteriota bacterium]
MRLSAPERLHCFYDQFSHDDHVLVMTNADPDAIASAMAVKRLLWRKTASVTMSHINMIKRPDNLAMVRLLGINLTHVHKIRGERFDRVVIVDSQPDHNQAFARYTYDVIIDHHPETGYKSLFQDIRPGYGATAGIMTEYLRAAKIRPSLKLATALVFAIKTDTNNFRRQTLIEDVRAFQFLFRHTNTHLLQKIEQSDLKRDFLKYFKSALETMFIRKGRVFVHLGPVVNPDICVLIAGFFMKVESINWSIISGLYNNKLVIVIRNDGFHINAGRIAQLSFGHIGYAGGHKSMARIEIPFARLKEFVDFKDDKILLGWIRNQITKKAKKT